jgi:ElaB/YqjD/DUF883 family membrane-anchored ribosome-binding protein
MSESTDAIRADIERTRAGLGEDVDALADKVTPSKIVHRQTDKLRGAFGAVRERVMGVVDDAASSVSSAGGTVSDNASEAAHRVQTKAEGNPLAVGLMAFGAGLLISSLIPASAKEKNLASEVKEKASPLVDQVTDAAKEVGAHLKDPAQDAATAVKDKAADAVSHVREDAAEAKSDVADRAGDARSNLSQS